MQCKVRKCNLRYGDAFGYMSAPASGSARSFWQLLSFRYYKNIDFYKYKQISIPIPVGNTRILGAYDECLSVAHHGVEDKQEYNIIGT